MNELYAEACLYAKRYTKGGDLPEFVQRMAEKFAELIIRECAEVAEDYDGAHYVGTKIKDHFGVK
jgi:hypothetical protein